MRVVNKSEQDAYNEQLERMKNSAPQSIELVQYLPEDEAPKELGQGVVVMSGDYYKENPPLVIAASAIGSEWIEVAE